MNLDEQAVMSMYYGEYKDMMACFSVYNGNCIVVPERTHDELMGLGGSYAKMNAIQLADKTKPET